MMDDREQIRLSLECEHLYILHESLSHTLQKAFACARPPLTSSNLVTMPPKDKYTDPKLRDEVKEEIHKSDKGGAPGQWSARKAQMMAGEYKKRGGGYNTDKEQGQDDSQKNLSKWGEEEWQTKDGDANAKNDDGSRKRYLPKEAWEKMDDKEKEETDKKKQKTSKSGQQFVGNTDKAAEARKEVSEKGGKESKDGAAEKEQEQPEDDNKRKTRSSSRPKEDKAEEATNKKSKTQADENKHNKGQEKPKSGGGKKTGAANGKANGEKEKAEDGKGKASGKKEADISTSKHEGKHGSKGDSAEIPDGASQASASRLPKAGQVAHWKSMPGWVKGEVVKVLTEATTVDGKSVKASRDDPRIVLKSHGPSGKQAVHKAQAVYF
ncbi:Protein of unknown function DUF2945 [Ceraceosorus bombacis]|uniref:Hypervirulence associated protein TUDOR domain-containing protein n=1 Tax=Ceraceosorus bombacis TaxID=401625 RepID=A0A0P1B9C4_9BASI|nr:Protein of unknown function DUF2945 [Ceraceosorus bombacis]